MAKSAKPAIAVVPQREARKGIVTNVEKRTTKAGGPMLVLTIGDERGVVFRGSRRSLPRRDRGYRHIQPDTQGELPERQGTRWRGPACPAA